MADYFSNFVEYFPRLMEGLKLTIIIAIFGILLAVALGIILCIFSISNSRILQKIASVVYHNYKRYSAYDSGAFFVFWRN